MKNDAPQRWEEIASRIVTEIAPIEGEMPFGFPTRVVTLWRQAQRNEALRRWSFWSLRAAFCSMVVCGFVIVLGSSNNDSSILLTPPSAEFIAPPLSTNP
jgi:hypothetical protein